MRYLGIALLVFVSGCSSQYMAERALARFGPYCEALGFEPKTTEYAQCVLQADSSRKQAGAAIMGGQMARPN